MSWRIVVIKNRAKLDYKMDYLIVRSDEQTSRIHLSEISTIIIENTAVSLTAYLLVELIKNKIKVIFCDEKHNPILEACGYYGSFDTSAKIRMQIKWIKQIKDEVWAEIIRAKILGQRFVLPTHAVEEKNLFLEYANSVEKGDFTNREGHAAKVYFNRLFGKDFSRSDNNTINAALDYGYGILLSAFNREITSMGYITQIGIHHDNMYNQFNLSCDLMEPFRPLVDKTVLNMDLKQFENEEKLKLVDILNETVKIDNKKQFVNNAIRVYTQSVFHALNENDISKIKFVSYEL